MRASKLLKVILRLPPDAYPALQRFLQSPYFQGQRRADEQLALFEYLWAGRATEDPQYFDKEVTYARLFPEQQRFKGKLEKLMSRLFRSVEAFLVQRQLEKDRTERQDLLALLSAYTDLQLPGLVELRRKKLANQLDQMTPDNPHHFWERQELERRITEFQSFSGLRDSDLNLPATHHQFDLYYLLAKLELACQLLARHLFDFKVEPLDDSLEALDLLEPLYLKKYAAIPVIQVYHQAYQLLRSFWSLDHRQRYIQFRDLLEEHNDTLSEEHLKTLQTIARSFCLRQYQIGVAGYRSYTFELYQKHLLRGWLYHKGRLLQSLFSNIVTLALREKAYDWTRQFLEDHRDRTTGSDTAEAVYNYNLSQYYFYTQQYDAALNLLSDSYRDPYYKVSAKRLEIKILYETESDLLDPRMDAFKIFIYRLPEGSFNRRSKEMNRNFIDLLRQIKLPKTLGHPDRIDKLAEKVRASPQLSDKEWLLDKLELMR